MSPLTAALAGARVKPPLKCDYSEAVPWLLLSRVGILYFLLCLLIAQQVFRGSLGAELVFVGYALLCVGFGFSVLESVALGRISKSWGRFAFYLTVDVALISAWIFQVGGRESLFVLLYLIEILTISLVMYRKGALWAAAACSLAFGLVLFSRAPSGWSLIWPSYSALFFGLGLVGGYLSEELKNANESLRDKSKKVEELLQLHQRLVNRMPTGLLTVDAELTVIYLNPAAEHILGKLSRDSVGKRIHEVEVGLLPFFSQIETLPVSEQESAEPSVPPFVSSLSATGDQHHRRFFLDAKVEGANARLQQTVEFGESGHLRTIRGDVADLDKSSAKFLGGGNRGGRLLLFQDVTKITHLEEKLRQSEKLAAVGQLAAGIAHEIRNPLASMSASIEMLKDSLPPSAGEDRKLMDIAVREIDRLNLLISEFLDFVKPERLKLTQVDLTTLLSEILLAVKQSKDLNRVKHGGRDLRGQITFVEKFSPVFAKASEEKLKQVIWNLVVNAIQSMTRAGTIEVGCGLHSPQRVMFWVQDEGQGITEEALKHLYEPFFTTKEKGTGLGLATAYKIVEAHQGEIRVETKVGQGTRFEVWLPIYL